MVTYDPEQHKEADEEMTQALAQCLAENTQAWEIWKLCDSKICQRLLKCTSSVLKPGMDLEFQGDGWLSTQSEPNFWSTST